MKRTSEWKKSGRTGGRARECYMRMFDFMLNCLLNLPITLTFVYVPDDDFFAFAIFHFDRLKAIPKHTKRIEEKKIKAHDREIRDEKRKKKKNKSTHRKRLDERKSVSWILQWFGSCSTSLWLLSRITQKRRRHQIATGEWVRALFNSGWWIYVVVT